MIDRRVLSGLAHHPRFNLGATFQGILTFAPISLIAARGVMGIAVAVALGLLLTLVSRWIVGAVVALFSAVVFVGVLVSIVSVSWNLTFPSWILSILTPVIALAIALAFRNIDSLPRHLSPAALLGVCWVLAIRILPWTSIDGLREITKRGGDGASFLRNFAMGLSENGYVFREDMGHTGGGTLATFIAWFQSTTSLSFPASASQLYQPMLMWRLYWLLIYCLVIFGVVIVATVLTSQSPAVRHAATYVSSIFSIAFSLAFIRPGLFTAVLATTVLTLAVLFAITSATYRSNTLLVFSVVAVIGATQSWMPFGAVGLAVIVGVVWTLAAQHGTRIVALLFKFPLRSIAAVFFSVLPLITLLMSPFGNSLLDVERVKMLLGTGGGDAPINLQFVLSTMILIAVFSRFRDTSHIGSEWFVILVAAIVVAAALIMFAAFVFPPYWLEYGPKKFFAMCGVVLLPLSVAFLVRFAVERGRSQLALIALGLFVMWGALSTEPLHQLSQVLNPAPDRAFIKGLHAALADYPKKRVICIETAFDGNGYDAYDCSEFALGVRGLDGPDRLFMTGNLCWSSPDEYLQFDRQYYRDSVIVVSNGTRLSTATGCQEKFWEVDGKPSDSRWLLGWVTNVKWRDAIVLDYSGKRVTPSFQYLKEHPEYTADEIARLEESL